MELFDLIPPSIFTILTSKNREVYIQALFVLRATFKQEIVIERGLLTNQLINELQSSLFDMDPSADDSTITSQSFKEASSLAHFLIRRLKETGWIEIEYNKMSGLSEYVTLPPYAIKMINALYDMCREEVEEYNSYLYGMYSALLYAEQEHGAYRYTALLAVYEKVLQLEDALKTLFHNLKRRYTNLGRFKTANQLLAEHFDSYQKDIIQQIYYPLKTKDSINRFKGSILKILSQWMRSSEVVEELVVQAKFQDPKLTEAGAHLEILSKMNTIVDKLNDLEQLVSRIDERNNAYVSAATEKMRYLLRSDKSIKGKLTKLFEQLARDYSKGETKLLETLSESFELHRHGYIEESSLFTRSPSMRYTDDEPLELPQFDAELANQLADEFAQNSFSRFTPERVNRFVIDQMGSAERVNVNQWPLEQLESFLYLMHAFLKGFETESFYRLEFLEGRQQGHHYDVPNMDFVRRRNEHVE